MSAVEWFLRARLDEDERVALAAQPNATWLRGETWWLEGVEHETVTAPDGGEVAFTHLGYVDHIARHDPARVLREVEAKRRLLARVAEDVGTGNAGGAWVDLVLHALAAAYADHPDYPQGGGRRSESSTPWPPFVAAREAHE